MFTLSLFIIVLMFIAKFAELNIKKDIGNILLLFTALLLTLFVGIRYSGTDFLVYNNEYFRAQNYDISEAITKGMEPGLYLLIKISSFFFPNNSTFFFVLMGAITNILFCFGVKKYTNRIALSIFLYIISFTYFTTFNISLQFVAIMITFYSIDYLIQHNRKKYVLSILIAFLFHYTSLLMLILLLIPRKKYEINFKTIIYITIFGVIISFSYSILSYGISLIPLLGDKYINFLNSLYSNTREASIAHTLIWITEAIAIFFFYQHCRRNEVDSYKLAKFYYFTITFLLSGIFIVLSLKNVFWIRVGEFLNIYGLILIPEFVNVISKKERVLVIFVLIILYLTVCIYLLLNGSGEVYPFSIRIMENVYKLR